MKQRTLLTTLAFLAMFSLAACQAWKKESPADDASIASAESITTEPASEEVAASEPAPAEPAATLAVPETAKEASATLTPTTIGISLEEAEAAAAKLTEGVYFVRPHDGDVLEGPVITLVMGVKGKEIRPMGRIIPGTGHHHLIINSEVIRRGRLVPKRRESMHFGDAQTEVPIRLPKGEHKLTLLFANGLHISYGEKWSQTIHITVK
jgi:hypothetical protein